MYRVLIVCAIRRFVGVFGLISLPKKVVFVLKKTVGFYCIFILLVMDQFRVRAICGG